MQGGGEPRRPAAMLRQSEDLRHDSLAAGPSATAIPDRRPSRRSASIRAVSDSSGGGASASFGNVATA
jgi:hypothetical protein